MGASQFQRDREPYTSLMGDTRPDGQESETLRARIAGELRMVERMQRVARPAALIVFALLGLLAILQLYTWIRLEQLAALSQQREERVNSALTSLQEAIDKQKAGLEEGVPKTASRGHVRAKAVLPPEETSSRDAAAPRPQPKPAKATKEPQPAHRTTPGTAAVRPVPDPAAAAPPAPAPSQEVPLVGQKPTVAYQASPTQRTDAAPSSPESSASPTGQGLSEHPAPEATQNEPREVAEASGMRFGQTDTVIARDHNDIERLRKLGQRDYVEFTLLRYGSRQVVAPDISLELRKVDSKRLRCALSIYSEDYEFPAELAINEPVVFPVRAMWESVQLVINKVGKDSVGGYLTARKGVLVGR